MRLPASVLVALLAGCANVPQDSGPKKPPGLVALPGSVAFVCVTPGCDSSQKVRVTVEGSRRVAVKRIVLSNPEQKEFTFTLDQKPPFVVGVGTDFELDVRYVPVGAPVPGRVDLVLSFTDASPTEDADRLPPGELIIPLVRRLVGEPRLLATPSSLSFGAVPAGTTKSVSTRLSNGGFGNVALQVAAVDAGDPDVQVAVPEQAALAPDAGVDLPVVFAPKSARYLAAVVEVVPTASDVASALIAVEGTSLPDPTLGLVPATDMDFGELPLKQKRTLTRQLVNQGGAPLKLTAVTVVDPSGNVTASVAGGPALTLEPLQRVELSVTLEGKLAGPVEARVTLASNDPKAPQRVLVVRAVVTEPRLTLAPAAVDFGTVPLGWVVTRPVELRNTGYGALTIKNVTLVAGTSNLFTLRNLPTLPFVLERNQRVAVELEFRVETTATFGGSFSIETDDPKSNFSEVTLKGIGGTCAASCSIANGTPSCTRGTCEIASCAAGYFDTDKRAASGCECREVGTDPGAFCATSNYVGVLKDTDKGRASVTGVLPEDGDVDLIRFYAEDAFSVFNDNFDVRVQLSTFDPSIKLCVYRSDGGAHNDQCYFTNESCPSDGNFRKNSSGIGGDGGDFIAKVFRAPGKAPTCSQYTLFLANGF
jgi:hypothetical protein